MIASVAVAVRPPVIVTTLDIDTAFVSIPVQATVLTTVAIPVVVVVALDDDGFFGVGRQAERHGETDCRNRRRRNDETAHETSHVYYSNCFFSKANRNQSEHPVFCSSQVLACSQPGTRNTEGIRRGVRYAIVVDALRRHEALAKARVPPHKGTRLTRQEA
jgi:hypothetical protein